MSAQHDIWDPAQYARFGNERLRPALDLLSQVRATAPRQVIELGCGTGALTAMMKARWPDAQVMGLDGSEKMLARARDAYPACRFELADIARWTPAEPYDVLFSNATLQWLPDHATLVPRLARALRSGGWLALQMPAMHDEPLRRLQVELARDARWVQWLGQVPAQPSILNAADYYDLLQPLCAQIEIWQTTYLHALAGEHAVLEWASGTSLRPYLEALPEAERASFKAAYAQATDRVYRPAADGRTLLPFKRMFIVARV